MTHAVNISVTSILEAVENPRRRSDAEELIKLMRSATGVEPVAWNGNIIGFGNHHYKYDSGREGDTIAVGFSPRKAALVLYGLLYDEKQRAELKKLGSFTTGKGCIYIKSLDEVDYAYLSNMVSTAFRKKNN